MHLPYLLDWSTGSSTASSDLDLHLGWRSWHYNWGIPLDWSLRLHWGQKLENHSSFHLGGSLESHWRIQWGWSWRVHWGKGLGEPQGHPRTAMGLLPGHVLLWEKIQG